MRGRVLMRSHLFELIPPSLSAFSSPFFCLVPPARGDAPGQAVSLLGC